MAKYKTFQVQYQAFQVALRPVLADALAPAFPELFKRSDWALMGAAHGLGKNPYRVKSFPEGIVGEISTALVAHQWAPQGGEEKTYFLTSRLVHELVRLLAELSAAVLPGDAKPADYLGQLRAMPDLGRTCGLAPENVGSEEEPVWHYYPTASRNMSALVDLLRMLHGPKAGLPKKTQRLRKAEVIFGGENPNCLHNLVRARQERADKAQERKDKRAAEHEAEIAKARQEGAQEALAGAEVVDEKAAPADIARAAWSACAFDAGRKRDFLAAVESFFAVKCVPKAAPAHTETAPEPEPKVPAIFAGLDMERIMQQALASAVAEMSN